MKRIFFYGFLGFIPMVLMGAATGQGLRFWLFQLLGVMLLVPFWIWLARKEQSK